jgi:hypothetical protein
VFDADVVGLHVSPGLADGEAALGGLCHELQLDPFAALFEAGETLPMFQFFSRVVFVPDRAARSGGPFGVAQASCLPPLRVLV